VRAQCCTTDMCSSSAPIPCRLWRVQTQGITAADIVNRWTCVPLWCSLERAAGWVSLSRRLLCRYGDLEEILREYGDEPESEVVAQAIVEWRGRGRRRRKIHSTLELRFVIEEAISCTLRSALAAC